MIQLYGKGTTDFSKKGITMNAQTAAVTFQDNGRFDLDLTMPVPENISFDYGMILRASVPEQHVPAITLGMVSYYTVSAAEGSTLWSVIPTLKKVYYKQWTGVNPATSSMQIYNIGDRVTYRYNNYKCIAFDPDSPQASVPPNNNSSWWEPIPNTTGQAGKEAAAVALGSTIMKTADFNSEYMEAATLDGKTGYIRIADVTATGDTETRVIPAQTITAQNFEITEIEKSSDGKQVTLHAEHVSYGLGRTMLGDCNLVGVNPATAILFIQGAMKESYGGGIYTNLPDDVSVTADWSWKNAQAAILDPKAGLLQFTAGQMIRNDLDVYLIEKGEAVPKYQVKYGVNLTAVKYDGSVSSLVTRIYPTAQTEDGDTLLLPEEHIDTVRLVPFIRPEVLNTGLKIGQKETQSDGTEIELTEDIIFARMREAAQNRFNIDECDKVDITLEVDWIHLPDTEEYKQYAALRNAAPGEWVQVTSGPLGVNETIQLTGYTFDPILERYQKATFGKNKVSPGVASYDIQTGAISGRALAAGAVGGQNIQANCITAREIEAGSITADKIASRSITAEIIAANAITADAINAGSVTAEKIAAHAITAQQIAAHAITADEIAAGAITADAIASGTIQAGHIMSGAITTEKIAAGAVDATRIAALAITADKLAAGAVNADKIAAGAINAGKIDVTDLDAINATLGTATIAAAVVGSADINFAHIKDLNAQSAFFGQTVFQEALGGKLYVPRLAANYAQIVNATISDLVIQATNDNFYKLDVDLAGNVTATQITPSAQEIEDGHTSDGRTIYLGTDIVASDLNTMNIYASHALMDEITANIINVDKLLAREAVISWLDVQDLSSNTYIRSVVGDWVSGSTITQTINGINTRIQTLGYGTFFYQETEPSHEGLVAGDVWIKPTDSNSWEDVSQYTWQDLISRGMTWDEVLGKYEMYCWTGQRWKLLYDSTINTSLQTQIDQNAYAITLKADQSTVNVLSQDVTEFAGILEVQSQQITAAVQTVNAKGSCFVQDTDPTLDYEVHLGDTWVRGDFDGKWRSVSAKKWSAVGGYKWSDLAGAKTFVWNGTAWIPVSDRAMEVDLQARIDITSRSIDLIVSEQLALMDEVYRNTARITIEADRITQEVERAQNAENGKISKTTQYQTADAIVSEAVRQSASSASGLYIAKTQVYQTADAIVQVAEQYAANAADAAEAAAKGASILRTTQYQTAASIVTEAVRQSGVNAAGAYIAKTNVYQTADAIVSTAQTYASSAAATAEANAKSYAQQQAAAAETAAKNASIAKTEVYQSAAAIVTTAERYADTKASTAESNAKSYADTKASAAETNAKNASIAKITGYSSINDIINKAEQLANAAEANAEAASIQRTAIYQTASAIVAAAESYTDDNAYGKVSGISITANGIDISGSQYVKIASGGYFQVKTGDFGIDTNVAATGYAMWAGGASAADSYFRVKKNGEVTLTKLLALGEDGTETEVNLKTSGLWKLAYKTVKSYSTSGGYLSSMTFSDGNTVNFKSAASVLLSAAWSSSGATRTFTVSADNGKSVAETLTGSTGTGTNQYASFAINSFDSSHKAYGIVTSSPTGGGNVYFGFQVDAASEYNSGVSAGKADVTLAGTWKDSAYTVTNSGNDRTSTTGTISLSRYAQAGISDDNKVQAVAMAQGEIRVSGWIEANDVYKKGWNECKAAATSVTRYTRNATPYGGGTTHYYKDGTHYVSCGTGWYKTALDDACYHLPGDP